MLFAPPCVPQDDVVKCIACAKAASVPLTVSTNIPPSLRGHPAAVLKMPILQPAAGEVLLCFIYYLFVYFFRSVGWKAPAELLRIA